MGFPFNITIGVTLISAFTLAVVYLEGRMRGNNLIPSSQLSLDDSACREATRKGGEVMGLFSHPPGYHEVNILRPGRNRDQGIGGYLHLKQVLQGLQSRTDLWPGRQRDAGGFPEGLFEPGLGPTRGGRHLGMLRPDADSPGRQERLRGAGAADTH